MVKVSKESLEVFQSVLETVDASWRTEFNLRETVRQSFELIKKAKEHKVSWERIAEILKQSSGVSAGISPESIRQYYFEFSKNPDLLPKKKRKSGRNKKKCNDSTDVVESSASSSTIATIHSETAEITQSVLPTSKLEAPHQAKSLQKTNSSPKPLNKDQSSHQIPEPIQPKNDIRSQFNLGRRGK